MSILKTLLNVESVTIIILIMMLKEEIVIISLRDIEELHIETAMSIID